MTPEELKQAIIAGDQDEVIRLIATASEADRRKAAPTAIRLKHELLERFGSDFQTEEAAGMAILGTCTLTEMKKLRGFQNRDAAVPKRAFEILKIRHPDWLSAWAEWKMENGCPWIREEYTSPWLVVRILIRAGLISRPTSDGYIVSMIRCYEPRGQERGREYREQNPNAQQPPDRLYYDDLHQILADDPALLEEEVWRLFEVEGIGKVSLASMGTTWQTVMIELSDMGKLDRQRLLTCSLQALQRDFTPFHAGWFSRFHEVMNPTLDERAERLETYLALAGSAVAATTSFALKALAALDKAERLPPERVAVSMRPAMVAREKGIASLALRLLERAVKRDDALTSEVAIAASEALEHASGDVQRHALDLLEALGAGNDPIVRTLLEARFEGIAPSLKPRVAVLLQRAAESKNLPEGEEAKQDGDLERLLRRAEKLAPTLARLAEVEEALRAVRTYDASITRLVLPLLETPRLDPAHRQVPITDLEELIDLFAALLETGGPADDVERVLDGVSRLGANRPADFERRTSALRKRAETLIGEQLQSLFNGNGVRNDLCGLALAWTTGTVHGGGFLLYPSAPKPYWLPRLSHFLSARVMEIARNVAERRSRPLLAAPTHAGGWIAPTIAVERFRERDQTRPSLQQRADLHSRIMPYWKALPDLCDIVQALLRLAPDQRKEALERAKDLQGEPGDALRYALGAEDVAIGSTLPLWVAAARARSPLEDDAHVERRFPRLGPGGGRIGHSEIHWPARENRAYRYGKASYDPPLNEPLRGDLPTILHFTYVHNTIYWHSRSMEGMRWFATVWPLCRYPWWISGSISIGSNLDWIQTIRADVAILEMMASPDEPITKPAAELITIALAAKEPGQATTAVDVLITAIADTRLDGTALGQALVSALRIEELKPQRWAKTLAEASRTSLLHAFVIREAIERFLSSRPQRPPLQMIGLFELLVELGTQTGQGVTNPEARSYLEGIQGGAKAARLSRTLLELPRQKSQALAHNAAVQILTSRIERAERWQKAMKG